MSKLVLMVAVCGDFVIAEAFWARSRAQRSHI